MTILALTLALIYCVSVLTAAMVVSGTRTGAGNAASGALPSVVVVVAARNEGAALPACLDALVRQDYPEDHVRFVVVDDHSTDATASIASACAATDARVLVTATPAGRAGKAVALAHGIACFDSDVIVTTDADCVPPSRWLRGLVGLLWESDHDIVGGPTIASGASVTEKMQTLDWLLLFGLAGAFSASGVPITAMGNNMAIRRDAYVAAGGYSMFASTSTEDYALFQAVNRMRSGSARLILLAQAVNYTRSEPTIRDAFGQRRRWAHGGLDAPWWVRALYGMFWLGHVSAIAAMVIDFQSAVPLAASMALADLILLVSVVRRLGVRVPWMVFPLSELFKFAYVALLPISLAVRPRITWKGQRHRFPTS